MPVGMMLSIQTSLRSVDLPYTSFSFSLCTPIHKKRVFLIPLMTVGETFSL